jgi:hypothetical protein
MSSSSGSSSSSSSSSSPEPEVVIPKSKKSKDKSKSKKSDAHGRNEGTDPDWPYHPPAGMTLLNETENAADFDWDEINDDSDTELWVIRVPEGVRTVAIINIKR